MSVLPSRRSPSSGFLSLLSLTTTLALHSFLCAAIPIPAVVPSPASGPVISSNFPDPSIIQVDGTWYAFATTPGPGLNVQLASSTDYTTWTVRSGYDALPTLGAWAAEGNTWAPDVVQRPDGTFIMYYSAPSTQNSQRHCIGAASSSTVQGPYTPEQESFTCPLAQGGAIDPDGFFDPADSSQYVVYKVDGNKIGHGGECGNTVAPIVPTPILLQQVASDAITPVGDPIQLIDRDDSDGPLVEAPSLVRGSDGTYTLFYTSGCYLNPDYTTKYATAPSVSGPYTKQGTVLATGTFPGLTGPGSVDVSIDGTKLVFHSDINGAESNGREMWAIDISL